MQEFIEHVNTLSRINFFFFFILLNRIWKKYFYQIQTISSFIKLHVSKIKIKQLPNPYFFRSDELSFSPLQNHDYPRKTTNAWKDKMSGETNCQFIDKPNRQYVQLHDSLFLHVKKKKHAIITNLILWYPKKKKKKKWSWFKNRMTDTCTSVTISVELFPRPGEEASHIKLRPWRIDGQKGVGRVSTSHIYPLRGRILKYFQWR